MDKLTKKRQTYNSEAVTALAVKYGVTEQFVRQCIRGDRTSATADTIKKMYKELASPSNNKINEFLKA